MKSYANTALVLLTGVVMSAGKWNDCANDIWVPFRKDGAGDIDYSFYACIQHVPDTKPDWENSHQACQQMNSTLAYWHHWKELAFYYNAFQQFKQTLTSSMYFMVLLNLREKPFPQYETYYRLYDQITNQPEDHKWGYKYLRETMINVRYRRYAEATDRQRLDINCGAFRMEKNSFVNSDIEFVPCNESAYRESLVYDIQNDLSHFLCRRERTACPSPTSDPLGQNVHKIEGIYSYYYGTLRKRSQVPSPNLMANVTTCHKGCGTTETKNVIYYSGDWLLYWCTQGYKADQEKHLWEENYAYCDQEGKWQYEPCRLLALCNDAQCLNGGIAYNVDEDCECDCVDGWRGRRCENRTLNYPCHSNPCLNNGTCLVDKSVLRGYKCVCVGAIGDNCQFELNECSSSPCADESLCVDRRNGYRCVCDPLRQGKHCNKVVPYCTRFSEPCKNGAECYSCNIDIFKGWCEKENRTQYMCSCKMGFIGVDCSITMEEKLDAWQIFSIVLGCMLFVIVALFCEIIGSRRRHDHDNLQVLLESIDGYLRQQNQTPTLSNIARPPPKRAHSESKTGEDVSQEMTEYGLLGGKRFNGADKSRSINKRLTNKIQAIRSKSRGHRKGRELTPGIYNLEILTPSVAGSNDLNK